jgi:ribosome assembly protein YihI (activator of Der GTPase)
MPQGEQELGIQESQELPEISLEENTQALNRLLDQLEAASTVEKQRNAAGG